MTLCAAFAACADQAAEPPSFSDELAEILSSARVIAGADSTVLDGELGNVRHARLLTDSTGVVVSDFAPPFLRVFDRQGKLVATALPRGSGPQEAKSVYAIAVSGANLILVLTSTGLREFAFEGDSLRFVNAYRHPLGFSMFTLASYCDDGWAAYIPPATDSLIEAPILAVTTRDASGRLAWKERLRWPTQASVRAWGKLYQMGSDHEHVYVRHDYHPQAPILAVPCDSAGRPSTLRATRTEPADDNLVAVSDRDAVAVITYPHVLYTGFALWRGKLIESVTTTDQTADGMLTVTTTFSASDSTGRRSTTVRGDWRIMDARAGDVLVSTEEPYPRVLLLQAQALVGAIR